MGFTGNIGLEAAALGKALLMGGALGIYYDLFRILRRVFRFGYAMILGQDLFFWITGAIGIFFGSVVVYEGQLRILFVLAALAGWGIYAATVGTVLMTVTDFALGITRRVCRYLYNHTLQPVCRLLRRAFCESYRRISARILKLFCRFSKKREKYARNKENSA